MAKEDLGGCVAGSSSFFELLHEHLSNDHIVIILEHRAEDYCDSVFFRFNIHGLIIPVMDDCSVLSFLALFLELKVFLKDRGKTISLQHASLMHDRILGCRQIFKVIEQRNIVSLQEEINQPLVI